MPEIGEVSRVVHFCRKHLVGRTVAAVQAQDDPIVYGKVGTSAAEFASALKGKKVLDACQQGKYFWLVMSSPPHPLMHFGMAGWMKFRGHDETRSYKQFREESKATTTANGEDSKPDNSEQWPPRSWKFILKMDGEKPEEAAFTDGRRLGRIRLIDAPAENLRQRSPLVENGPDPIVDANEFTEDWLIKKVKSKKVPIKALLLDQANISGIGNWVADEVLYNAKMHPEQYSNSLSDSQIRQLHQSIMFVCQTACETLADSNKFPEDWLMKHRWNKGKKGEDMNVLPNGHKIVHITVGGRTSAVVPSIQKKTGPVAGDADEAPEDGDKKTSGDASENSKPKKASKRPEQAEQKPTPNTAKKRDGESKGVSKRKQMEGTHAMTPATKRSKNQAPALPDSGQRRSARIRSQE